MKKLLAVLMFLILLATMAAGCACAEALDTGQPANAARTVLDITGVCEAVLTLLAALVTSVIVPLIRAHTCAKGRLALDAVYRTAVYGAQQLYKAGVITDRLSCAQQWIREQGYTVDRTRLEAHVKQLNIDTAFEKIEAVPLGTTFEATATEKEEDDDDG